MLISKLNSVPVAYTFDDFQLAPVHSTVRSRKDPDVSVECGNLRYRIPVIASPMNTVTETNMARVMYDLGGTSVLHRYKDITEQVTWAEELFKHGTLNADSVDNFWVAVGANGDMEARVDALASVGVHQFCVDVANGHSVHCIEAVHKIRKLVPNAAIMAGNVCTYDGAYNLAEAGADAIRVGIGPGSMCTTRIVTGHGIPQLTAIEECSRVKHVFPDVCIIADGGLRSSGDMVKALAIGADMCMLGSLLAGTSETPGDIIRDTEGRQFKYYHGMASEEGREQWFSRDRTAYVPEGASTRVAYKGETYEVVERLIGGLRVGMSYAGAFDLAELRQKAQWVRITGAGRVEATPHGI